MKFLSSLFSCVYGRVKLFVFAMNSRRRYSIFVCFIYGLEDKNSKSQVIFAFCHLRLTSCLTSLVFYSIASTVPCSFTKQDLIFKQAKDVWDLNQFSGDCKTLLCLFTFLLREGEIHSPSFDNFRDSSSLDSRS